MKFLDQTFKSQASIRGLTQKLELEASGPDCLDRNFKSEASIWSLGNFELCESLKFRKSLNEIQKIFEGVFGKCFSSFLLPFCRLKLSNAHSEIHRAT